MLHEAGHRTPHHPQIKMGEVKATLGIFIWVRGEGHHVVSGHLSRVGGRMDLEITTCSFSLTPRGSGQHNEYGGLQAGRVAEWLWQTSLPFCIELYEVLW